MTDVVSAVTVPAGERDGSDRDGPAVTTTWHPLDSDEYDAIEETRRTADVRSPLSSDYDFPAVMEAVLGRESATCEACQETVRLPAGGDLTDGDPFVLRELVANVYTVENQVLLCESCANCPVDDWKGAVRAKRARECDAPRWDEYLAHWFSDPTASSVFARRLAMTSAGLVALVSLIAATAGVVGTLFASLAIGVGWARTVVTSAATVGRMLVTTPWAVGTLISIAYTAHAVERVRYDPRGYRSRDFQPWVRLAGAGMITALGTLGHFGMTTRFIGAPAPAQVLTTLLWASGAFGVAWYIDLAIRHDLAVGIWTPARWPWLIAGRVGLIPGLLAMTVGVPVPTVAGATTTGALAAMPAVVALTFAGRRLPADSQARDAILDRLPERLLTALSDNRRD